MRSPSAFLLFFAFVPTSIAQAGVGLGASAPMSNGLDVAAFADLFDDNDGPPRLGYVLPSFDLRVDELVFQIHALETIISIGDGGDAVVFGGNGWTSLTSGTLGGEWEAFAGVGGSADLLIDSGDLALQFGPVAPIGVRFGTVPRVAIYVQPGLYLAVGGGVGEVVGDADLLVSVWF